MKNRLAQTNTNQGSTHTVTVETRYVRLPEDTHGWMGALRQSGSKIQLCEFTKVVMIKDEDGRTYFRIMDGPHSGRLASMPADIAKLCLRNTPSRQSTEILKVRYGKIGDEDSPFKGRLRQQWATLTLGGQTITVTLNSIWDGGFSSIPPGHHRIMTPDRSHANISTEDYRNSYPGKIKANDVWFPIELEGRSGHSSRYIHIGHLSEGCVTVHDIIRWNTVYNFLISHRLPNTEGKYVALLEVAN